MTYTRRLLLLMLAITLALTGFAPASAQANATTLPSPTYRFEWTDGTTLTGEAIVKQGVSYIGMDAIVATMTFFRLILSNEHKVKYEGFRTSFTITLGKSTGELNGKTVQLGGIPFKRGEQIFVPARFLVTALRGSKVSWDPKQQVVSAKGLRKDLGARIPYGRLTYSLDFETGELTLKDNVEGIERKLIDLAPILGNVTYRFRKTKGGLLLLTITDNSGEPRIHYQQYQIVLKNRGVIRQSSAYFYERVPRDDISYGDTIVLTNGKQLRLIEDGTGRVMEKLDLVRIGGEKDNYYVEGMDEDFLLLRANQSGMLKLYERRTQETVLLYKQLLDPSLFEITENYAQPLVGRGDYLTYVKREGDQLLFRNEAPYLKEEERSAIYRYTLAKP